MTNTSNVFYDDDAEYASEKWHIWQNGKSKGEMIEVGPGAGGIAISNSYWPTYYLEIDSDATIHVLGKYYDQKAYQMYLTQGDLTVTGRW